METMRVKVKRIDDLDAAVPGLGRVWRELKERTGTRCRCPKSLVLREAPEAMHLNDGECGRRYALDLANMRLSDEALPVSSGEWACHGGPNHEEKIDGVPPGAALVELVWQDYHRYASLAIQVPPGSLRRLLPAAAG
jgi:hypothetical protein